MRYVSRGSQADALSSVPTCAMWVPPPLTKGTDPEVCFSNSPECKSLVRASSYERWGRAGARKVCKQM